MVDAKIIDVRDIPSGEAERIGKMDTMITYQFDAFRTYIITLPKETFTKEKLIEEIRKQEHERAQLIGTTIGI